MRTKAVRDGDDWVLTGTKCWMSGVVQADWYCVFAKTGPADSRLHSDISCFVVERSWPGVSVGRTDDKMGVRGVDTGELVLDGVRLPADAMLPNVKGLGGPLSCLTEARFGIIFGSIGAARDCLEATLRYAAERDIFDKPLGGFQITQAKLADMTVELGKSMLLALHLGRLKDALEQPLQIVA